MTNITHQFGNCVKAAGFTGLLLWVSPAFSNVNWHGYINDKGHIDEKYGYIETRQPTTASAQSKLRLTCYPPLGFRVYLTESMIKTAAPANVTVRVDQLNAMDFPVYQDGRNFFISDRSAGFWDFIAQLVAGISLEVRSDPPAQFRYSLRGFSTAYKSNCGWVINARNYLQFIDRYR